MQQEIKEKAKKANSIAHKCEAEWGACSQCTIKALQEVYNEESSDIFQALGGFAAGGAWECDGSCGAYAAGIYFFGTKIGRRIEDIGKDPKDPNAIKIFEKQFALIKDLHERFTEKYGSIICSNVHRKLYGRSFYLADPEELEKFDKAGAHIWGCPSVCGDVAEWVVEIFEDFVARGKK